MNTAVRQSMGRRGALVCALAAALATASVSAPGAVARSIYVANSDGNNILVIDGATNQPAGSPIGLAGAGPVALAISPDGKRLYSTNGATGSVSVIDAATNQTIGGPIKVGNLPEGIAITPDGSRAYVANRGSNSVTAIDTGTDQVVGEPIKVGAQPGEVAITPDGSRAYVANEGSNSVSAIDTKTNQVIGEPIKVGMRPIGIAITPDGSRAYIANHGSADVSVIDTATNQVIGEPNVGVGPVNVAITPDGSRAYVSTSGIDAISVIDTGTNQALPELGSLGRPEFVALSPNGKTAYLTSFTLSAFRAVDLQTSQSLGNPVQTPAGPRHVAVAPDQPPVAAFSLLRARPGIPAGFNAAASTDPDGAVATYAWAFGDGKSAIRGTAKASHAYGKPGRYRATLTLTDNEGCSASLIFTGQTAYCNGSAVATTTKVVKVAYPGVRVKCPRRAGTRSCAFKLRVVAEKPRKGKGAKAQSVVARAKVKAGHSAIVSLKAKKAFRSKLARAKKVLVEETVAVAGSRSVSFRRLKIVQ